jgi:hypothetical protein
MNRIEVEIILDKTEILYIEVLRRFSAEDDLAENLLWDWDNNKRLS